MLECFGNVLGGNSDLPIGTGEKTKKKKSRW
jgi:hypothetical protein